MELKNGFHKTFLVVEKEEGFRYRGNKYLFDNEARYFVIDSKIWAFDYHESLTLPIRRTIDVGNIIKTIRGTEAKNVLLSTNPSTLERFIKSKIAEGIMRGAELDEFFKLIRMLLIIILIGVYLHLFLFAQKSGILSSVSIPGIN